MKKIIVLLGSTKNDSVNQKMVNYFKEKNKSLFWHWDIPPQYFAIGATVLDKCAILVSSPKSEMNTNGDITDIKTAQLIEDLIQNFREQLGFTPWIHCM